MHTSVMVFCKLKAVDMMYEEIKNTTVYVYRVTRVVCTSDLNRRRIKPIHVRDPHKLMCNDVEDVHVSGMYTMN